MPPAARPAAWPVTAPPAAVWPGTRWPAPAWRGAPCPRWRYPVASRGLRELLEGAGCEALLISSHSNIRYLTGFTGSAGLLMVRADDAVIVTDGRYAEQAPAELALSGAPARTEALGGAEQVELLGELVKGIGRLGLEGEHISWARLRRWSEGWAKDVELVPTSDLVEGLRERKDAGEIARIGAAAAIADAALASVRPMLEEEPDRGRGRPRP